MRRFHEPDPRSGRLAMMPRGLPRGGQARASVHSAQRGIAAASARDIALAAFLLCSVTGLALHGSFDPRDATRSIATWLLGSPGLTLLRNLHYWSALLFAGALLVALWRHLAPEPSAPAGRFVRALLVLSLPCAGLLLASGFLLRGDADARLLQPLLAEFAAALPFAGPLLADRWLGQVEDLSAVLQLHTLLAPGGVALALALLLACAPRPRAATLAATVVTVLLLSLLLAPGLNDGLDRRTALPGAFAGLGALRGWLPGAWAIVGGGLAVLWCWWARPRFPPRAGGWIRRGTAGLVVGYAALTAVEIFRPRTPDSRGLAWPDQRGAWRFPGLVFATPPPPATPTSKPAAVPTVLGRVEGCLICHQGVTGLGDSHRPEAIGCASCHGGDTTTLDADRAHAALIRVPGNLADAPHTCGTAGCHPSLIPRVERSIMATFSGVIDVNRRIFGETVDPAAPPTHVRDLQHSAADSHLRQLCVSCHLGTEKETWGPIGQESRGGGCNACHLTYSPAAATALDRYLTAPLQLPKSPPPAHPALTVNPENDHCFGCHSRSGRISLSYEGWHELREAPPAAELARDDPAAPRFRQLDDGRHLERIAPDVHQVRGLDCIDCHTATEIMGSGHVIRRKSEALQVRCEDCHARPIASQPLASLDAESQQLLGLRRWTVDPAQRFGTTRSGAPVVNVFVAADGTGTLRRKRTGESRPLRPPAAACQAGAGHDRLSCASCHTAWAPRCASCHTGFDPAGEGFDHLAQREVKGTWIEKSGAFEAAPPTLGVRLDPSDTARPRGLVDTFVPGMILELDRNRSAGAPPDPVFHRLYAHLAAHTIARESRSCRSCHLDPVALGFGRGELRYDVTAPGRGRWRFTPALAASPQDGLPADAWTGFLQTRTGQVSTRDDVRPFDADEQRRVLTAGACLTCHADESATMQAAIRDFAGTISRRRSACAVPDWQQ